MCSLCGRSSCIPSFHSLEDQEAFNSVADRFSDKISRLEVQLKEKDTEIAHLEQRIEDLRFDLLHADMDFKL